VGTEGKTSFARSTGFVASDEEKIYYEVAGQGETIVFCHGAGGNHANWYQQVPAFVPRYRVVTWDHRGFGRSTDSAQTSGPKAAVSDLTALLDHLGVDRAHLVGQSMGGWTILGFTLRHPDRVRSLVFANTIAGIQLPEVSEETQKAREEVVAALLNPDLPVGFDHPCFAPDFVAQHPARAFLYMQLSSLAPPTPMSALLGLVEVSHTAEELRQLACPVLFLIGTQDPLFTPSDIRKAASLVPGSKIVEIPGTGHSPYFEDAEQWNRAVLDFLQAIHGS
jgi:pimeloyl-ACP methyl ester carboxylesterase